MSLSMLRARRGLAASIAAGALAVGVLATAGPAQAAAPTNDGFAAAAVLSGTSLAVTGSSVDATTEASEPLTTSYGDAVGSTVWYRWTAPATADYAITTDGSDFDTTLTVFTGSSLGTLKMVTTNDDGTMGNADLTASNGSETGFHATAGTTYAIQVGGYAGAQGTYRLALGPASIAGTITYEATAGDGLQDGCVAFYADLNSPPVGGGCGNGTAGQSTSFAVGLLPAGQYYAVAFNQSYTLYPGTTDLNNATKITIPGGGCTLTGFAINLDTAGFSGPAGKDCSAAPACISAKKAVGPASAALAADRTKLAAAQRAAAALTTKIKQAKKHHKPAKVIKKLKKQQKRANAAVAAAQRVVNAASSTLSSTQAKVKTSC